MGSRNMQTIPLLRALGRARMPVLLKQSFGCTIDEWVHAAEYVLGEGNPDVVMCERGIRTFETATRFILDVAAVPIARRRLGFFVIIDPSHAAGHLDWVECLTLAGVAAGCNDLLIESHPDPAKTLSDGPQAVPPSSPGSWRRRAASRTRWAVDPCTTRDARRARIAGRVEPPRRSGRARRRGKARLILGATVLL
jgi:3-deoxy-7-phosphoheptulonate synthase